MQQIQVSDTLSVEVAAGGEPGLRIVRDGGGLVLVRLEEVKALVAALSELAGRAAAEASGQEYVEDGDLW